MQLTSNRWIHISVVASALGAAACSVTGQPRGGADGGSAADAGDGTGPAPNGVDYMDDLAAHPGCTTEGLRYPAASIPGYPCAAKQYPFPAGVVENSGLPIVLLVHGNSDTPASFERFPADSGADQLSEKLVAAGVRTLAVDLRIDRVDRKDPVGDNETENAARNIDHGWSVPIVQQFIRSVVAANPGRHITIVAFSLGVTVTRDALRRLTYDDSGGSINVWGAIDELIYLAGANHGVSSCALCGANPTMRGRVTCEMGCRDNFSPTEFLSALNGSVGAFETPCGPAGSAFGRADRCAGNQVGYTTVVMRDLPDGTYQDLFVSEASARLAGADNRLLELTDVDESGYFFDGLFRNHYGSCRSAAALAIVMSKVLN